MQTVIFPLIVFGIMGFQAQVAAPQRHVLAEKSMSLENRYAVQSVNDVFKYNILLAIAYLEGKTGSAASEEISKPFTYEFTLKPGETFAFHDTVMPEYKDKITKSTHAHFSGQEGFKSDGYLMGDGVCHLASLIRYAVEGTDLKVVAPTAHDFAAIPEVPKEYGVSIYTTPDDPTGSARQNLYITNTLSDDVTMAFDYNGSELKVSLIQ